MKDEKLYIYYYPDQKEQADSLLKKIQSLNLKADFVNLNENTTDVELVNGFIEKSSNPFPLLRIGEQKIRGVFQNPSLVILQKIFSSENTENQELPKAIIYCTDWCGDCHQLKMWMDSQKIPYSEILIEDSEELKEQIVKWSGGRRVIPTVDYGSIGRLFNPGITVFQNLYK